MFRKTKRILAVALAALLVACVVAPVSVGASLGSMFSVVPYTDGGGYILQESAYYLPGELVTVKAVPNDGFAFYCWVSDDVVFVNEGIETTQFVMPAKDVTISAVFAIKQTAAEEKVSVTFDTMGGSSFASLEVKVGECVAEPATVPTKEGFNFGGWYADAICTMPFSFETPITTATFIYAKWEPKPVVEEAPDESQFSDVKSGDWFYNHVMALAGKNIISGMGKKNGVPYFAPQEKITRAQFVKILLNIKGENIYIGENLVTKFSDVKSDAWYAAAVSWAYSVGVAKGVAEDRFNPEAYITRQDMAVMISNYVKNVAKISLPANIEAVAFSDDANIASYAKESVSDMQKAGIISGKERDGSKFFAPRDLATRAETSKMVDVLVSLL